MKSKRYLIFVAIGIAAAIIAFLFYRYAQEIEFFSSLDLKLKDVRFRLRHAADPDPRVVIVAVDAKSVNELGRWPWDRKVIAGLIGYLKNYGAKTVALDIVFSEPSNPDSDKALADAIQRSGNVIAGHFFREEAEAPSPETDQSLSQSKIKVIRIEGKDDAVKIPFLEYAEANLPAITRASNASGFFNIIPDSDGIIRKSNLLMLYDGEVYPSLALSALRHYLGKEILLDIRDGSVDAIALEERTSIPVDEWGALTLNFYGKKGTFRTVSAVDVIRGRLRKNELKDSLVFVGATEIGIYDVRVTPVDSLLPGVEIHATVASNVLQNRFLVRNWLVIVLEVAFMVVFPVLLALCLGLARRTMVALLFFLAAGGGYTIVNQSAFSIWLLNTVFVYPLISISLTYLGSEAYRNFIEERQGRFLKKAFTSYVSPELVGEIIKNPGILKLGGEKREVSILFSDIRGFTTLSEKLSPEDLVTLLNEYLGPMTDIVLAHKGTLDKYIGDAIMAIFNAPLTTEKHAMRACETAIEMIEKLKEINVQFKNKGFPEISIGIGINTAEAIVGNMGTHTRFDYTAVGDSVNLASRLEGLNKIYGTRIIISESTLSQLESAVGPQDQGSFAVRELDSIKVKGKDKPVVIYELSAGLNEELRLKFAEGLRLYREGSFKEAGAIFSALAQKYEDKPSVAFVERCGELMARGCQDWDGIYVARTK
ncbi:MAG: adenylate/guanylate cyclase domain-containing protein [Pseudomonadota bacterium]